MSSRSVASGLRSSSLRTPLLLLVEDAVTRARRLDHPNSLGYALAFLALTYRLRGEAEAALRWAEETLALGTTYHMQIWTVCGQSVRGWALARQGDAGGLEPLAAAVAAIGEAQPSVVSVFYGMQAEAQLALGLHAEARAGAEAGLAAALAKDDHWYEAEFHRLRGSALRALGHHEEADAARQQAIACARAQGAAAFEARALERR